MIDSGITDHIVEDDVHTPFVGLFEESFGIVIRAITWRNLIIVADVVASIVKRRVEERVEPDSIHTKTLHIVEFADNTLQVTESQKVCGYI